MSTRRFCWFAAITRRFGKVGVFAGGKNDQRVELAAALVIGLAVGIFSAAQKIRLLKRLGEKRIHVQEHDVAGGGGIVSTDGIAHRFYKMIFLPVIAPKRIVQEIFSRCWCLS